MNDVTTPPVAAAEAAAPDFGLTITVPHSALAGEGQKDRDVAIDLSLIPGDARLELLRSAARTFITNRVNVANVRANKALAPWLTYEAAMAADPLQTAVAKPTGERPQPLDTFAKAQEAIADLLKGEVRTQAKKGEGKSRAPKDPLVAAVTPIVTRALFEANKTSQISDGKGGTRKYSYPDAVKAVGGDGIAYLNTQIDAKVAAVPEAQQAALRKQLESQRDTRYIEPAKVMIGQTVSKKSADLPSIL
jgi:hypothetical protein